MEHRRVGDNPKIKIWVATIKCPLCGFEDDPINGLDDVKPSWPPSPRCSHLHDRYYDTDFSCCRCGLELLLPNTHNGIDADQFTHPLELSHLQLNRPPANTLYRSVKPADSM